VHVAKIAGLPKSVIGRAREVLHALEEHDLAAGVSKGRQLFLFATQSSESTPPVQPPTLQQELWEALEALNPDDLSPREAHVWLSRWKDRVATR
jgi:DNA mismatch repair protein MutS